MDKNNLRTLTEIKETEEALQRKIDLARREADTTVMKAQESAKEKVSKAKEYAERIIHEAEEAAKASVENDRKQALDKARRSIERMSPLSKSEAMDIFLQTIKDEYGI
ncbi:hypothetical protein M1293_03255 [Candidatus Parvarchaeota archaeon]|nr:hypothetical protein [Candidatus Parvarchaeota archaeon]